MQFTLFTYRIGGVMVKHDRLECSISSWGQALVKLKTIKLVRSRSKNKDCLAWNQGHVFEGATCLLADCCSSELAL